MSTISPNMNLIVPTVGSTDGPTWADDLNASLSIIDQHNHSGGSGVAIQPAGLNINSNLTFQNNSAIALASLVFTAQSSVTTVDALYVKGVDLYYRDGSNNEVRMTSGGSVNATSSGISDGTASVAFVSSVLTVLAAATTPADIKGGSLFLGNNSAGSKYLKLSPPNAMAANYTVTLPALPAASSFMQIDSSGNITNTIAISGGLTTSNLSASAGITGAQLAAGAAVANIANNSIATALLADGAVTPIKMTLNRTVSSSCGSYSNATGGYTDITNLTGSLTTVGKPVTFKLVADGGVSAGVILANSTAGEGARVSILILEGLSTIASLDLGVEPAGSGGTQMTATFPCSSISHEYTPAAGTYTWKMQAKIIVGSEVDVKNAKLIISEI